MKFYVNFSVTRLERPCLRDAMDNDRVGRFAQGLRREPLKGPLFRRFGNFVALSLRLIVRSLQINRCEFSIVGFCDKAERFLGATCSDLAEVAIANFRETRYAPCDISSMIENFSLRYMESDGILRFR